MSEQVQGAVGKFVDGMIRRAVRHSFHSVWWIPPKRKPSGSCIVTPNHHGWHDGYLMYQALRVLDLKFVGWMEELDAFPPFAKAGGMPFPADKPLVRIQTIRRTIRILKEGRTSLLLFPEGVLHPPPDLLPFGKAVDTLCGAVPEVQLLPVAIRYELSMHERPEAFILFGEPEPVKERGCESIRFKMHDLLNRCEALMGEDRGQFQLLVSGTKDVNERWDMRRLPWPK